MTQEELNAIPKEHFRFVLKGNKVILIFTDDGVSGGSFWEVDKDARNNRI
ncbi:hypothetical protein H6G06_26865 [Anabaena sphaerica FACHB-251]|uniref:Uncharacterized protein n=1 Tax=Anabaena sphaerica FACHB-251 TaxID=2692883 RepID=A0A926WPN3_9NOST|nr:hypothetical protein [Anabaena sphaerica]MBD2296998.1 hypothetical protein [Anabaena sphaerica FACHB-251]